MWRILVPLVWLFSWPALAADQPSLDDLFAQLQTAEGQDVQRLEGEIWAVWSESGSPAMNLLLERGRQAIDAGDYPLAIGHLTALTDHAPDFAEGWNARATAYFYSGEFGQSISDIRQTLALNPRHFGALSGMAMMLEQMERPEDALRVMREVEKLNPHQDGLADTISRLLSATGQGEL